MERSALIKFGGYDHLRLLRDRGQLYMNNLPYFRKIEDDELRGDPNDSVDALIRGTKGSVTIPESSFNAEVTNFLLRLGPENPENINLFCMYAMRPQFGTYPIDEKNFNFGSHALVFHNSQEFINRLDRELQKQNIIASSNLVEYLDMSHSGDVGLFKKLNNFKYQSEWRLVCENGPERERILEIGCLSDISEIFKADEVNNQIQINP